ISDGSCKSGCPRPDNGVLKYKPGNFYEYSFESILTVGLSSSNAAEADDTSLKVTGTAKVYASGNCGYSLQVGTVKVVNTKESVERKILNNIQKPVQFTLASGQLEPLICADPGESRYSLNIKRAIISLLQSQTDAESANEIDVFGSCPTHSSTAISRNGKILTKVRDLNSCAHREQINSGLLSGILNEKSGVTSSAIFQADYSKELRIERGIVESVQLNEVYRFAGTTKGSSDVTAKVSTTLKLRTAAGQAGSAPAVAATAKPVSIIFEKSDAYATKNLAALKLVVNELVDLTVDYVKKDTAKKFVELIRLMRHSDVDTLLELSTAPHPKKALARKVYLDALFRTNTADSAKAILKQLPKFEEKEKLLAIFSLNMVERVDKETLSQASQQLLPGAPKEIYLAAGNLVGKFCKENQCEPNEIGQISKKFIDGLKHCKPNTKKEEERIVYVLKGIGNAQTLVNNVATALSECIAPGRSNRIRIAALQAFSAVSCKQDLSSKALQLLKDTNEDSELRIEAYLAAIKCPTVDLAKEISDIVNAEPVHQVGSFIESNLRVIRDSTDPTREHQKYYLGNIRVTKQFPKDYRRFSFNNEFSYRLDALGLSGSSDYKLIYSQNGFLPRSARLNLTAEILGNNFNVFEANLRQENLENLLEYYVGPKGLLNKDFDEIVKLIEVGNPGNSGNPAGRGRRSIVDDAAKIGKRYKSYGSQKSIQDLNLDLSIKLFGSELAFLSLGDNIPTTLDDIIKHFSEAFDKAKKELTSFETQFASHQLFLDSQFSYPTGVGIPLELGAQGFAANKVDFAVNIDVNAILEQNWQRAKYRLRFVPSIDVTVNLHLGFNTQVLATGVRVTTSAHTATGSDVSIALIKDGDGFNVNVELPREKLELIDIQVRSEFYVAEQDKPIKPVLLRVTKSKQASSSNENCLNQFNDLGLGLCIKSSTPLLTDSSLIDELKASHDYSLSIYLTSERKINVKGTHLTLPTGSQQWKLQYSTPESKVSHDTSLAFELGTKPNIYGRLSLDSSQYHLAIEAGFKDSNQELVIYGQHEQNKDIKKSKIGFIKNGNEYRPVIEIEDKNGLTNNINGYHANGKIVVQKTAEKQSRYNFQNFQILNRNNDRIQLNGWVDLSPTSLESELRISPNQETYLLKSIFKLDNNQYALGVFVNDEHKPENVYGTSAQLKIGKDVYTLQLVGKALQWSVNSETELGYVNVANSNKLRSAKFSQSLIVQHRNKRLGSLDIKTKFDENQFELNAAATSEQKLATVDVKYEANQRSVHDYELTAKAKYNKHTVDVVSRCLMNNNLFNIDNSLMTSWGTSLTAKGELGQRYSAQDIHIDLQGTAQLTSKEKPVQWLLKVIGVPEKTSSELRISRDNGELLKLLSESQHPQDKVSAAKVNLMVKNLLTAKADLKIAKNNKGELVATVETLKTEPKHKLEVNTKFHIQQPKYDIDGTITLDGSKKIHLKTENNIEKLKFATKNLVEWDAKKYSFDANGGVKGEWRTNGDVQGAFKLTTPENRIVDGTLARHLTTNPRTQLRQGSLDVQVNEQDAVGGKKRSISYKGTLDRMNIKTQEISVDNQLTYSDFNGKKTELTAHGQYTLKDSKSAKAFDIGFKVDGHLVAKPIELAVVIEELTERSLVGGISGKYGQSVTINLNGKYNGAGEPSTPATYELQLKVQAPETRFKNLQLSSNGKVGSDIVEFVLSTKSDNGDYTKVNTVWQGNAKQGTYTFNVQNNHLQAPVKVSGSYQNDKTGSFRYGDAKGNQQFTINADYGDKYIKSNADVNFDDASAASLTYKLDTSNEHLKNIEIVIQNRKPAEGNYGLSAQVKQAGKSYTIDSKIYSSSHKKGVELRATLPDAQPIALSALLEILGERKAKLSLDIQNLIELDLQLSGEASYVSVDDFYVIGSWNSKKLHLDNYELDVRAQGKSVKVLLKHAQGVEFSGNASYNLKKEQKKSTIEGQGQVQYKGKTHNSNFKLQRQQYNLEEDQEIGFAYTFNGNFGPKNGVSTIKLTNKEFNTKLSICEERKQCTNIQLQSSVRIVEDKLQHDVLVLLDLRELGYPYELELKSKNIRENFKTLYNLDARVISSNNLKYQLTASADPSTTSIQLTLPKRQIAFETKQQIPEHHQLFGRYEQSAAFYIDKLQRPNDVARISAILDLTGVEQVSITGKGQLKLEHPTIRPLTISGTLDANRNQHVLNSEIVFDIFRSPEQKVVATHQIRNSQTDNGFNLSSRQEIKSTGLRFQYQLKTSSALNLETKEFSASSELQSSTSDLTADVQLMGNKERFELQLSALNEQIVRLAGTFDWQKRTAKLNSKLHIFGQKAVELSSELQPTWAKLTLKRQDLIDANAELKLGKELKFDVVGTGKPILNGRIALDPANFLQTSYKTNDDDVKAFLESVESEIKKETEVVTDNLKKRFEKVRQDIERNAKLAADGAPDFTKLRNGYESQMKIIIKELESDPSLKPIVVAIRNLFEKINKAIDELTKLISENYEKLTKTVKEVLDKLNDLWENSLLKIWEQLIVSLSKVAGQLRIELVNIYTNMAKEFIAWLEKYGPALKNYGKAINDTLRPLHEAAQELIKVVLHSVEELLDELKEYVAKLPTFEALRNELTKKIKEWKIVERTLETLNNIFDQLSILPQTPEIAELLQKLHEFLEAKLRQQQVDDDKWLDDLSKLFLRAVRSVLAALNGSKSVENVALFGDSSLSLWPASLDGIAKLPLVLSFRSSVINFLLNENWEGIFKKDLLSNWLFFHDFELHGHIVDGQHVFSFDGQSFAYPGNCKYIFAQDSVDKNFTVIGQLNNGKLKAITLIDRDGNFVEVSDNVALKVNGKPVEYPQHLPGIHTWRRFYTVHIHSEYGVNLVCTTDLKVCHVNVNGFYTSKTRGLLGNGNAEPYDDFLLIDGTLASNSAALGNDYAVGKCSPVAVDKSKLEGQRNDICSDIFGIDSPLALNYLALDVRPYRSACDVAVAGVPEKDRESLACTFALAYGSALKLQKKWVLLPPRCLKCAGAVGQRELGEEFTVKIPSSKADVVFVVDINVTPTVLSNLIAPAITDIRESLKTRGFTDVQIGVIAFDETKRYPALLTSDNGNINYRGNVANVQLNGPNNFCENCVEQIITEKRILEVYNILERFIKSIVPQSDEKAFYLALDYPFRAGAAKSIIGVRSNSLEYNNWWKFVRAQITGITTKFDGALLHLIAPIKGLAVEGVPAEKLAGFNARLVATLDGKDNKKRAKLQFENDMGIDFVLNNGGWAFNTQNFDKLKAGDQKKLLNQVTSSIADTLFKTETISECRCLPVHGLHGQHKCQIKSSTFVPNKKPKSA
ncbi:apolipophorins, partial [Drosophila navojoa]|uniref:apolipophorins n=1 Tax=Drosophila navojoa TaxID=7232 RepID=UPI000846F1A4